MLSRSIRACRFSLNAVCFLLSIQPPSNQIIERYNQIFPKVYLHMVVYILLLVMSKGKPIEAP
nr:MAG TPA: hypothetical protein [Caudoviricetes sp.]